METLNYNENCWEKGCPKVDCRKNKCHCGLKHIVIPADLGDDSKDSPVAPKNGNYCNSIVIYQANKHVYIYSEEGVYTLIDVDAISIAELEEELREALAKVEEIEGNILNCFDTVADMKASVALESGSYAKTLGYYSVDDGGSAVYKIVDDEALTDDGGSVVLLDNGLKAKIMLKDNIRLSQFGIDASHNSNINNFISYVNDNNDICEIEFEPNTTYRLDTFMGFNKQNLNIIGNGATIKIGSEIRRGNLFQIVATKSCRVDSIIINGDDMPQNQWSTQTLADYSYRRCFYITSPCIEVNNVLINNVWGQGLQLYGYETVDIKNCVFDKIGGGFWYQDPDTGAYDFCGDAVYLSGHNQDANININNCVFVGYENTDQSKNDSRCGIVFENLAGYQLENTITNAFVYNTVIKNFSRPLHHEAYKSSTNILMDNCDVIKAATFVSSSRDYPHLVMENCRINYHNTSNGYSGTSGFYRLNAKVNNSQITLATDYDTYLGHESNIVYTNCVINGIHGIINTNSITCELDHCTLNFDDEYNGEFLNFSGYPTVFKNCIFNKATQYASIDNTSGSRSEVYNCVFNDIYPTFRATLKDFMSVLNLSTSPNNRGYYFDRRTFANGTVTVGGQAVSSPNICGVLPADEHCFLSGNCVQSQFNSSSLPIIPATLPSNVILKRNTKYLMLMYGTNDGTNQYNNTFENVYYTDLIFDANGVGAVGTINTKGTIPAPNELTFSGATVTGTGSSATRYITWILPYYYKSLLGI